MSRNLVLGSSSRCHPHGYLDHLASQACSLFQGVAEVLFIPFARPGGMTHAEYTHRVTDRFAEFDISVRGIDQADDPIAAVLQAEAVFIGGGNTFVLLSQLYSHGLIEPLRNRILSGLPYLGTSAGSNVAGLSIGTSNDMPIMYPPSFQSLGVVPFNINPHFPVAKPDPTHQGETREDRIGEFHDFNGQPVIGLHEDGWLRIQGESMELCGQRPALLFRSGKQMEELPAGKIDWNLCEHRCC